MKLELRSVHLNDIDRDYAAWYQNADGHLDYFTGSGRVFNREMLVADFEKGTETGLWFYYLIIANSVDRVGTIKIGPIDKKNKTADLVALVGNRDYLGKGVATRAIALANSLAFDQHDIRRLHSGIFATNLGALKAYTRAGWVIEATMKGFYWVNGRPVDRVCVACFNPRYFPDLERA